MVAIKHLVNAKVSQLTSVCSHFQHVRYSSLISGARRVQVSQSVLGAVGWVIHQTFCGPRVKNDLFLGKCTKLTSITLHE